MTDPFDADAAAAQAAQTAGHQLQQQLTAAQSALAAETAKEQADQGQIAALQAQVTELENQLHPQPATVFGIDVSGADEPPVAGDTSGVQQWINDAATHRKRYGAIPHVRVFSSGKPLQWGQDRAAGLTAADQPVFSFKTWDLPAFTRWMDGIPAGLAEAKICYRHEPEDDAKRSGNPAAYIAAYLQVYAQMDAARKAHPNGAKVKLVKIMMDYQEVNVRQAGVTYKEFHGGQTFVDYFGWDCYWGVGDGVGTAEKMLGPVLACAKDIGITPCVPELGVRDPAQQVPLLTDCIAYARANGFAWVNYWCEAQWGLEGNPPAMQAWKAAITASAR